MAMREIYFLIFLFLLLIFGLFLSYIKSKESKFAVYFYYILLCPCFLFPVSIFFLMLKGQIFYISFVLPVLKFYFGAISSWYLIFFSLAININILISIKLIKQIKFYKTFFVIYLSSILFLLTSLSPDLFLSFTFHSLGQLIFIYLILFRENKGQKIVDVTRDFLWQRVSDFFAFIGLLLLYLDHGHLLAIKLYEVEAPSGQFLWPAIFLFFSLLIRPMSSNVWLRSSEENGNGKFIAINYLTFNIYGSLVLLYKCYPIFTRHKDFMLYAVLFSIIIIGLLLFRWIYYCKRSWAKLPLNILLFLLNIVMLSCDFSLMAYAISAVSFSLMIAYMSYFGLHQVESIKLLWPFKIFIYLGNFFGQYVGPLYADFICFRLPQSLVIIMQLFLRIFHGNNYYMRGVFIVFVLLIYFKFLGNAWTI